MNKILQLPSRNIEIQSSAANVSRHGKLEQCCCRHGDVDCFLWILHRY